MIFFGLILVCLHLVCSQKAPPEIIDASSDKDENLGSTVELSCTMRYTYPQDVVWSKLKSSIPIFVSNVTSDRYPRISASVSLDSKTGNTNTALKIINVNHTDAGVYECGVLQGTVTVTSKQIELRVKYPPVIDNNTDSGITISKNNSGKLECNFTGYPNPTVTWNRENNARLPTGDITYNGTYLTIANASREFAGIYYCKAENSVGKSMTKKFVVKVEYGPEIQVKKSRIGQALNFNATLECYVWASPQPKTEWYHNGNPVPTYHQHFQNEFVVPEEDFVISKLTITAVERTYFGNYTCVADNKIGKNSATVEFFETNDIQCATTCGSNLDQPDLKLLISTTMIVAVIFVGW